MVVPDGVVQAQRFIALAPAVAGTGVFLDDDGGDIELAQARTQRDAALAAADDDAIGLARVAQFCRFLFALFQPAAAVRARAMLGAHRTAAALGFFKALQFTHGGEQGPDLAVADADEAHAARHLRFHRDPALQHATGLAGVFAVGDADGDRLHGAQLGGQHGGDLFAAFQGFQVPGKQHQVAPVAVLFEQLRGARAVAGAK